MKGKKPWTKQEDQALLFCVQTSKKTKWNVVAQYMNKILEENSRNQKQCRQRYVNHLMLKSHQIEWSKEKQEQMIELHRQFGNKWVKISQQLPKTTQSFVKNRFYTRLRASVRKLNKYIRSKLKNSVKMIKEHLVFNLTHFAESRPKKSSDFPQSLNTFYIKYLYQILEYTSQDFMAFLSKSQLLNGYTIKLIQPLNSLDQILSLLNKRKQKNSLNFSLVDQKKQSLEQQEQQDKIQLKSESLHLSQIVRKASVQLQDVDQLYNKVVLGKFQVFKEQLKDKGSQEKMQKKQKNKKKQKHQTSVSILKKDQESQMKITQNSNQNLGHQHQITNHNNFLNQSNQQINKNIINNIDVAHNNSQKKQKKSLNLTLTKPQISKQQSKEFNQRKTPNKSKFFEEAIQQDQVEVQQSQYQNQNEENENLLINFHQNQCPCCNCQFSQEQIYFEYNSDYFI